MTTDQHINNLLNLKDDLEDKIWELEKYIRTFFPNHHDECYQHWIPQLITAIRNDSQWLSRGQYSIEDTINSIRDSNKNNYTNIKKYL